MNSFGIRFTRESSQTQRPVVCEITSVCRQPKTLLGKNDLRIRRK